MVKEIFFHYSEFKGDLEALQAGDDVEFTIKDRNVGVECSTLIQKFLSNLGTLDRSNFAALTPVNLYRNLPGIYI